MVGTDPVLLAVGGYTTAHGGAGRGGPAGLTTWWWDGGTLIEPAGEADLASPSFVCWHPTLPILYAVSEVAEGAVTALAVADDGTLTMLETVGTGGAEPCWVTTDPVGATLLIANYGSGSMAVIALDDAGLPTGDPVVVAHQGSGPVADRQEGPHVHQIVPTADGHVLASDLGTDQITRYRIDPDPEAATVTQAGVIDLPPGTGPRHMALAAGGRTGFVSGELNATVTVIRNLPDAQSPRTHRWAAAEQVPSSQQPEAQPSQVLLGGGDRWLLIANRGPDTLAVLDVGGGLAIRQEVPTGEQPRHFVVEGDRVLLACQGAGTVELFELDEQSGTLTGIGDLRVASGGSPFEAPACVSVRH